MKKNCILNLVLFIFLVNSVNVFAKTIELPDITTEVESENIKAGNDTLPDFEDVLRVPSGSGIISPVLPDKESDIINIKRENGIFDNQSEGVIREQPNPVNNKQLEKVYKDNEVTLPENEDKEKNINKTDINDNKNTEGRDDSVDKDVSYISEKNIDDQKEKLDDVIKNTSDMINENKDNLSGDKINDENNNLNLENNNLNLEKNNLKIKKKFIEANIGGGFPFLFYGDCLVFNSDINNPYKILLKYDSVNGYMGRKLSDNFSDKTFDLSFERKIKKDRINANIFADLKYFSNGLQHKTEEMSAVDQNIISGYGFLEYNLYNDISIESNTELNLYNRYGIITSKDIIPEWVKGNDIFTLNQKISSRWAGYGLNTELGISYLGVFSSVKNENGNNNNRGKIWGSVNWANDFLNCYGEVCIIIGNRISSGIVIVPFSLGLDFSFPVYFSNRKLRISIEGGLESYYNSVDKLENKFKFAAFSSLPSESSFWNCNLRFYIPLKASFSASAFINYKHTAFCNGVWEPDYSNASSFYNGLYKFIEKQQQLLMTNFSITYHRERFAIKCGLYSNWLDVPVLEGMHNITLDLNFQDENLKWGINLSGIYKIDEDWTLPVINLEAFLKVSPRMRINLSLCDIIPLFNLSSRMYAGSYADRGFTSSIYFNFDL